MNSAAARTKYREKNSSHFAHFRLLLGVFYFVSICKMCPPAFGRNVWELVSSACVCLWNNKTTNHRDWEERETVQLLCVLANKKSNKEN
jgi:hypothetical protein